MRCYLVQSESVTALLASPKSIGADSILLHSITDLDARRFPLPRLVALWNTLPGSAPIKRFTDRKSAVKRFWAALQKLPLSVTRSDSKQARLIELLRRPTGSTIDELMKATGWQSHSVRGVLSGTLRKKLGLSVVLAKDGNRRAYRIEA